MDAEPHPYIISHLYLKIKYYEASFAYICEVSESLNSTEDLVPALVCLLKILLKRDQDANDSVLLCPY